MILRRLKTASIKRALGGIILKQAAYESFGTFGRETPEWTSNLSHPAKLATTRKRDWTAHHHEN